MLMMPIVNFTKATVIQHVVFCPDNMITSQLGLVVTLNILFLNISICIGILQKSYCKFSVLLTRKKEIDHVNMAQYLNSKTIITVKI